MNLINEEDDFGGLGRFLHDPFNPFLELAAQLGAGRQAAHFEFDDSFSSQNSRDQPLFDSPGQPFDDRGFPDACVAQQERVGFLGPCEDGDDLFDFGFAADGVGQFSQTRELGEIATLLVQCRSGQCNGHVRFRRDRWSPSRRRGLGCRNARWRGWPIHGDMGTRRGGIGLGCARRVRTIALANCIERLGQLLRRVAE